MTTTTTKREINGIAVEELGRIVGTFRDKPELGASSFRVSNQWLGGDSNRTTVGRFTVGGQDYSHRKPFVFECGEPEALLGKDEGANPVEFLLHALAGCVTTATAMHAAARGIRIRSIETSIEGDIDLNGLLGLDENVPSGYRSIRFRMKIDSDAEGEKIEELKQLHNFSPVLDSIRRPVPVDVVIDT